MGREREREMGRDRNILGYRGYAIVIIRKKRLSVYFKNE